MRGLVRTGLLETDLMAAFQARYGNRGWRFLWQAHFRLKIQLLALTLLRAVMPSPSPIAQHAQRYLELHEGIGKDYRPNRSLLTQLDSFLEKQGIDCVQAITSESIERWAGTAKGSAQTRTLKVRIAWRFFNHLLALKIVKSNPVSPVLHALGRVPCSTFKPFVFTKEHVAAILDAARKLPSNSKFPLRASLAGSYSRCCTASVSGMGEACRLRVRDLSFREATLFHRPDEVPQEPLRRIWSQAWEPLATVLGSASQPTTVSGTG